MYSKFIKCALIVIVVDDCCCNKVKTSKQQIIMYTSTATFLHTCVRTIWLVFQVLFFVGCSSSIKCVKYGKLTFSFRKENVKEKIIKIHI